ncbi:hypothetical protein J6590_067799 [Homalodisca vitripennis]|nr:hypothetical protein J6590_067799 [Homalodisca vitripennis]
METYRSELASKKQIPQIPIPQRDTDYSTQHEFQGAKGYPQRVNKIHVVNPWAMVETGIALFKPLLTSKLQNRIMVHRNVKDLHRHIPKHVLPEDLGGDELSVWELNSLWREKMEEYRDWFLSNEKIKTDEAKRVGKCSFESVTESAFGNSGSFRKIEVD